MSDDLVTAADAGDHPAVLRALRSVLARRIAGCESSRDLASLSKSLRDTIAALEDHPEPDEDSVVDELKRRRDARRSAAARLPFSN